MQTPGAREACYTFWLCSMGIILDTKLNLRKKYRASLARSTPASLVANAQALITSGDEGIVIALYHSIEGEPNLLPLITQNFTVSFCLPKITGNDMVFILYNDGDELENNCLYPLILEPKSDKVVIPDIIFVPGIAFDIKGQRLGRGGGFYDKYIALHPHVLTIGVTFQEKLLYSLPHEDHDYRMHYIITENLILRP